MGDIPRYEGPFFPLFFHARIDPGCWCAKTSSTFFVASRARGTRCQIYRSSCDDEDPFLRGVRSSWVSTLYDSLAGHNQKKPQIQSRYSSTIRLRLHESGWSIYAFTLSKKREALVLGQCVISFQRSIPVLLWTDARPEAKIFPLTRSSPYARFSHTQAV